ncbi:MAG: phosphoribosyltransferase family protein [Halieaceae bacterium]
MSDKQYLCAEQLLTDSFRLAKLVLDSGFEPSMIIAIWRGGVPIGIAVQEFFAFSGVETDHIAIRTSSYDAGIDLRLSGVRVHGLNYLIKRVRAEDRLLIVDDVFDTGRTVDAVITRLAELARLNTPKDIRVAVPYYKPRRREVDREPDYYLEETDAWLMYPHSLEGLSLDEIKAHRPALYDIVKDRVTAGDSSVSH